MFFKYVLTAHNFWDKLFYHNVKHVLTSQMETDMNHTELLLDLEGAAGRLMINRRQKKIILWSWGILTIVSIVSMMSLIFIEEVHTQELMVILI